MEGNETVCSVYQLQLGLMKYRVEFKCPTCIASEFNGERERENDRRKKKKENNTHITLEATLQSHIPNEIMMWDLVSVLSNLPRPL